MSKTHQQLMEETLAEVTGKPLGYIKQMFRAMRLARPDADWSGLDRPISESEFQTLKQQFISERDGILAWLAEGAKRVRQRGMH